MAHALHAERAGARSAEATSGFGGDDAMDRAIRAHGNLTEYAPIFLLMMLIAEQGGYSSFVLHSRGGTFLLGRLMQGVCFGFRGSNLPLRLLGPYLPFSAVRAKRHPAGSILRHPS